MRATTMATITKPIAMTTQEPAPALEYYDNDFLHDPLTEYVDYENLYLFQTDIEDLRKLLPKGTKPLKIAAGKGLFGLGMQNFVPGQFDQFETEKPGEIQKIYAVIAIEPDYEIKMATPRFCFFALRVVTTDSDLNDLTYDINKAPIYRTSGLTITIDKKNYTASARDDDGPIFEITTPFRHKAFSDLSSWGQNATVRDGALYWQAWHWNGSGLEFFMNGKLGTFHDHPFLRGLNVSDLTCRHVFVAEGGYTSTMALYKPVPKDDVEEHDERPMREISKEFSDAIEKRVFGTRLQDPNYYYNRLKSCLAGGIHYNFHGFPLKFLSMQIRKGKGARVWDERGIEYLDLYGKFGALFLGHNHPYYNEKLKECIDQITVVDSSGLEQRASEYLIEHIPSAEMVRYSQSGTEAVQNAVRLARAYTGKG
ncbi:MAG: aminotransferase class III-fold pyridoxal phosphate-dependent enzyme, partial [Candidatus Hydrogenedentes bacterium]|nr:aminotransferase class III-fold pyridoxal phosphate-dependent enzyme [Candidatus Hydrogenedentota bacterium]